MAQKQTSNPANILYRPIGLASGPVGGVIAGQVFKQVWKHAAPGDRDEAPKALATGYAVTEILIAAAIQGAIFGVVTDGPGPRWCAALRALDRRMAR
jgi:hypothetical protein